MRVASRIDCYYSPHDLSLLALENEIVRAFLERVPGAATRRKFGRGLGALGGPPRIAAFGARGKAQPVFHAATPLDTDRGLRNCPKFRKAPASPVNDERDFTILVCGNRLCRRSVTVNLARCLEKRQREGILWECFALRRRTS